MREPTRDAQKSPRPQPERTAAEWITLGVSFLLVGGLLGLLVYDLIFSGHEPPRIEVEVQAEQLRHEGALFYQPIIATNHGDQAAENVWIQFTLSDMEGESENSSFQFRFLAPGEQARAVLLFHTDPASGTLHYTASYLEP